MNRCVYILKNVYVEPIGFFAFLGIIIWSISAGVGTYQKLCHQEFHNDASVVCTELSATPDAEIHLQKLATSWNIYQYMVYLLPAGFAALFLGAWADKNGRKLNIMMGQLGTTIAIFGFVLILGHPQVPLWVSLITGLIGGATGFVGIIPISCISFIADSTVDPQFLTIRMVIFQVFLGFGAFAGGTLTGVLSKNLSLSTVAFVGFLTQIVSFAYTFIRVPQVPPQEMRRRVREKHLLPPHTMSEIPAVSSSNAPLSNEEHKAHQEVKHRLSAENESEHAEEGMANRGIPDLKKENIFLYVLKMQKYSILSYTKKRPDGRRTLLLLLVFVYFQAATLELGVSRVQQLYFLRAPLSWDATRIGYYTAFSFLWGCVMNISFILVFKKVLKLSDTTVCLLAIASDIGLYLMLIFAKTTWMVFLCPIFGSFKGLLAPTVKSFVAKLVAPHEVGKVFSFFSVSLDVGMVLGAIVYNLVYSATVANYPPAVFFVGVGQLVLNFLILIYIHIKCKQRHIT